MGNLVEEESRLGRSLCAFLPVPAFRLLHGQTATDPAPEKASGVILVSQKT